MEKTGKLKKKSKEPKSQGMKISPDGLNPNNNMSRKTTKSSFTSSSPSLHNVNTPSFYPTLSKQSASSLTVSQEVMERRRQRFRVNTIKEEKQTPIHKPSTEPIVGTCTTIEKSYYRLTTLANPADIRPKPILKQAYKRLKTLWKSGYDMEYLMDQMKAIRQDLVVQHIADKFTVKVYEMHARMALEKGDLNEFNQCQSALGTLYPENPSKHELEFFAMTIIYDILMNNTVDLHYHLKRALQQATDKYIQHALLVLSAVRAGEYPYFMRLLQNAPTSNRRLMEFYLPTMQRRALRAMLHTAFPSIPVQLVASSLEISVEETQTLLAKYNIVFSDTVEIAPNRSNIQRIPF